METRPDTPSKTLIVVAGPTAVGKTDFCLQLAHTLNTEIVSADSRQFFREMNIGTAKPTAKELAEVKHHFINSHHITEEYNAGSYAVDAMQVILSIFENQDTAILTGGSGLYLRAVTEGIDEMPEVKPEIRRQLMQELQDKGLPYLLNQLYALDPVYYQKVDRANSQRVLRALEVCLASNKPYSSFRVREERERPFGILKIGLNRNREELYQRIDSRMDNMLQQGLLAEAESLYPYRHHNALQTVGYKEIFDFLEGEYDWDEAIRLLKRNSRRYAKRQLTWFRKDPEFAWFHPDEQEAIINYIQAHLPKSNL